MARYERGDEFWDFARDGATITIKTGKIGSDGTTTVEQLPSPAIAATRERVLLNQQGRAGWKLYKPPVAPPEPEPALPPQPVVYDARNPELERAILETPSNNEVYEVYGDWLLEQGDPHGKLIALERGTVGKPWGDKHHAQMNRFIDEHREYLFGPFEKAHGLSLSLRHGFVYAIEMLAGRFTTLLTELLSHPARRFVGSIHLDAAPDYDDEDPEGVAADLQAALGVIARSAPRTLRHLAIGGDTTLDGLDVLKERLPELESFELVNISDRELEVSARCMTTLAKTRWARLEKLTLELLRGTCSVDHVAPIFSRHLPKLATLQLRTTFDFAIAEALVTSPIAGQLEELSFEAPGETADALAELLVRHRERFPKLARLCVPHQAFSTPALESLKAIVSDVFDADGEGRYQNSVE